MPPSLPSSGAVPQPARRNLLQRLAGLLAGSFLTGPLQALLGRGTPAVANTIPPNTPYIGAIMLAGFDRSLPGYVRCDGQILPINADNTALFAILGVTYGGDGKNTFAVPNLNGRVPIGAGEGPGLTARPLGEVGGADAVALLPAHIPAHTHTLELTYSTDLGTTGSPANAFLASNASGLPQYAASSGGHMGSFATGSAQPHNNMQPYLVLAYYIAVQGVFPPRP